MKKLSAAIVLYFGLAFAALAQATFPLPSNQASIVGAIGGPTLIVTAPTGKQIIVTTILMSPVATSVVQFMYGGGATCGTGTTNIGGAMTFNGAPFSVGNGSGPVMILPPNQNLCITTTTAAAPGALVYTFLP